MLQRLREAGLIWPTVATIVALGVLVSLGTWQVQRKQWKDGLVARIAARTQAAPIELPPGQALAGEADREYRHVAASGRLLHDKERYLYAPTPLGLGWHVFTPLETTAGQLVWINRGFVPDARKDPPTRAQGQVPGAVRITGLIRNVPAPGMFTPVNDVARNLWYWPDIAAMTSSAYRDAPGATMTALPYWIDADARPEPPGGFPKGGVTRLDLPNRHLEYAITWYGLALTLIGVYLAFVASRLRPFSGRH
jgi:surfeit locus 1 family protein